MSKMKASTKVSLIIILISVIWIGSGFVIKSEEVEEESVISKEKEKRVNVHDSVAEFVTSELNISGKTVAESSVVIKSEEQGTVGEIVAKEGTILKKGDVIVKLNEDDRSAKIKEAEALVTLKELEYKNYSSLVAGGYSTKVKKTSALAEYESAKANLLSAKLHYEKSIIKAPFSGYLENIDVKVGDFINVGSVITKLINLSPIEIEVYVPEKYMESIKLGEKTIVSANGYDFEAEIKFISKSALEQTRSFLVKLSSPNKDYKIAEGLTVRLKIPLKESKAHNVRASVLALNDLGQVGMRVIGESGKVEFYPVETVKEEADGSIWVSGLPLKARIITLGQEYVSEGEVVEAVVEEKK